MNDDRRLQLEQALADLVHQVDIADYRDELGHPLKHNLAYLAAERLVQNFGLTHERLCAAMDECGLDPGTMAQKLAA